MRAIKLCAKATIFATFRFHLPGGTGPRPPTPSSCHSQHWSRHGEHSRWKSSNKSFKWLWLYNISHLAMNSVSKNTYFCWMDSVTLQPNMTNSMFTVTTYIHLIIMQDWEVIGNGVGMQWWIRKIHLVSI